MDFCFIDEQNQSDSGKFINATMQSRQTYLLNNTHTKNCIVCTRGADLKTLLEVIIRIAGDDF